MPQDPVELIQMSCGFAYGSQALLFGVVEVFILTLWVMTSPPSLSDADD